MKFNGTYLKGATHLVPLAARSRRGTGVRGSGIIVSTDALRLGGPPLE
jgi:hypothetical protein